MTKLINFCLKSKYQIDTVNGFDCAVVIIRIRIKELLAIYFHHLQHLHHTLFMKQILIVKIYQIEVIVTQKITTSRVTRQLRNHREIIL